METHFPHSRRFLSPKARILPTRNGNRSRSGWSVVMAQEHGSYLQGMETTTQNTYPLPHKTSRTDPTYKEWKPTLFPPKHKYLLGTDPTYKEWKLFV